MKNKGEIPTVRRKRKINREEEEEEGRKKSRREEPKSVLFCPYTPGSELAKKLRESEENMEKLSGFKIKIVEEAGEKIMDILHSSNPWRGENCGREGCWLCETKEMTEK